MQPLLDVLNAHAAGGNDDLDLAWEIQLNDAALFLKAATRALYPTRDEAWAAAVALRAALAEAVGEPRTDGAISVHSVPGDAHEPADFQGYRGAVTLKWWSADVVGGARQPAED